jgi:DNA-binding NarL/FixJ family response regulator
MADQITVVDSDGEEHVITVVGPVSNVEEVVESHGFDVTTVDITGPSEYIVRRTSETDYQVEDPDGTVLVSTTYQTPPDIPDGIAEDIVTYAETNGDTALHELRKMMLVGFRYVDDR